MCNYKEYCAMSLCLVSVSVCHLDSTELLVDLRRKHVLNNNSLMYLSLHLNFHAITLGLKSLDVNKCVLL